MVKCLEHKALARQDLLINLSEAESLIPLSLLTSIIFGISSYFLTVVNELDVWILLADDVSVLMKGCFHNDNLKKTEWVEPRIGSRVGLLMNEQGLKHDKATLLEIIENVNVVFDCIVTAAHGGQRDGNGLAEQ